MEGVGTSRNRCSPPASPRMGSYPDYANWLAKRSHDVDVGSLLPHAALRVYVMGERGAQR